MADSQYDPSVNTSGDTPDSGYIPDLKTAPYDTGSTPGDPPRNGQPQYDPARPPKPAGNPGLGIASMVLGILSVLAGCCLVWASLTLSIVGLVLGILVLRRKDEPAGRKMALAGVICSGVGLLFSIVLLVLLLLVYHNLNDTFYTAFEIFDYYI